MRETESYIDRDEIDLDEENNDSEKRKKDKKSMTEKAIQNPIHKRLHQLKLKINQSRHLNRKEVLVEAERFGTREDTLRTIMEFNKLDKKNREDEWNKVRLKSSELLKNYYEGKATELMSESASDSLRKAHFQAEKVEREMFDVNDYYNPEGQFRNYERNIQSIPKHSSIKEIENKSLDNNISSFHKLDQRERVGAWRLAEELKRRIRKVEKSKRKGMATSFKEDVSHINKRNQRFNEKINRNYDRYTVEIRQDIERGTALKTPNCS